MVAVTTTSDPYKALNLPHSASAAEIKQAFRSLALKHHPDRGPPSSANDQQGCTASNDFARVTAAYELLTDPQRKAQYDHIYKYGGFDTAEVKGPKDEWTHRQEQRRQAQRKSKGIGYTCNDPFLSFVFTQGRIRSTRTVAGIQIPSRFSLKRGHSSQSLRVAISSGQCFTRDPDTGKRAYRSQTTHFADGQKYTRSETTIMHPDGAREVLVVDKTDGGSGTEHRYVVPPASASQTAAAAAAAAATTSRNHQSPNWLDDLKDKLTMCYNPSPAKMVL